jgi:thiamine biosynthesis lipoprotein
MTGAPGRPDLRRTVVSDDVMGTHATVHVVLRADAPRGVGSAVAEHAGRALETLHAVDRRFSPFRSDSEISRIARGELTLEGAHAEVREVEAACRSAQGMTGGRFDAWWRGWFDPTGYVKGWATDRATESHLLRLLGLDGVVAVGLNVGGDLRVATAPGADWQWRIGIADPDDRTRALATLELAVGGIATSGTAERGPHIIDPRTGHPALSVRSVSVVADTLAMADVWATAAAIAGADNLSWVADAGTRSGLLLGADGRVRRWAGGIEIDLVDAATTPATVPIR